MSDLFQKVMICLFPKTVLGYKVVVRATETGYVDITLHQIGKVPSAMPGFYISAQLSGNILQVSSFSSIWMDQYDISDPEIKKRLRKHVLTEAQYSIAIDSIKISTGASKVVTGDPSPAP